ncbi:MAG: DMT family transporter, partial [Acidimicrobiales bacterium]
AAGFTKAAGLLLRHGLLHLLASWQVWALVVTGILGMVLAQSAFQAGALEGSLPAMAVVDPVVSIVIGIAVFGERLPTQAGALALEVIGLALMAVGVLALARAKAVQAVHHA